MLHSPFSGFSLELLTTDGTLSIGMTVHSTSKSRHEQFLFLSLDLTYCCFNLNGSRKPERLSKNVQKGESRGQA